MESIVMMDIERLKGLTHHLTFSTWRQAWDRHDAYKFVLLRDGKLLIGPISDHKTLYGIYKTRDLPLDAAKDDIPGWMRGRCEEVIGGGAFATDGTVTKWGSVGFDVDTPEEFQNPIETEILRLFQIGMLRSEPPAPPLIDE
jgi:hypothetical protein